MGAVWHEGDSDAPVPQQSARTLSSTCGSRSSGQAQAGTPGLTAAMLPAAMLPAAMLPAAMGPALGPAQARRAWWGCPDGLQPCHLPSLSPVITRGWQCCGCHHHGPAWGLQACTHQKVTARPECGLPAAPGSS